jgi:hypothetical protein
MNMTRRTFLATAAIAAAGANAAAQTNKSIGHEPQALIVLVKNNSVEASRVLYDSVVSPKDLYNDLQINNEPKSIAFRTKAGTKIVEPANGTDQIIKAFTIMSDGVGAQDLGAIEQINSWAQQRGLSVKVRERLISLAATPVLKTDDTPTVVTDVGARSSAKGQASPGAHPVATAPKQEQHK